MAVRETVQERLVAETWERQAFDSDALHEIGLRVVFRGIPSDAGGPDYQEAILATGGGSLLRGDVEFHVLASDWQRHGHHLDAKYNGVILHVVWRDDGPTLAHADGSPLLTVALERFARVTVPVSSPPEPLLVQHACVATFASLTAGELAARIIDLGWQRFADLGGRFEAELESEQPDQVMYAALMEGLGYASNRQVFRRLAEAVPYAWLMSVPEGERLPTLLHAAGLAPPAAVAPPSCLDADAWRLTRLRPANQPDVRLRGFVEILARAGPVLVESLAVCVTEPARPSRLRAMLATAGDSAIGKGRADELAVSVVLPLLSALLPEGSGARALYARYPSPPATRWTRTMTDLLRQAGHGMTVRSALQHQGLHLLYTRYCCREGHPNCPLCSPVEP